MDYFEKILKNFDEINKSVSNDTQLSENIRLFLEPVYDSLLSNLVNIIRNDAGNYDEIKEILTIRKKISRESKRQYNIIISFCKEEKKDDIKIAIEKYNFFHFLKYAISILDIVEDYEIKVQKCKRYFSDSINLSVIEKLYHRDNIPRIELKKSISPDNEFLLNTVINDLIIVDYKNGSELCSLSPEGKNLYAFFSMKNINFNELAENYNESKVNEVLQYLINYLMTESKSKRHAIEKPLLHSASANNNLNRVTALLDKNDNYNQNIVQRTSNYDCDYYDWKGLNQWKK